MSSKALDRYKVVPRVLDKRQTQASAAQQLGIGVRQIKRLCAQVRQQGGSGLISRQRGKPSNHRTSADKRERIMAFVRERYSDFGPLLACEYLQSEQAIKVGVETLRQWMMAEGLWKPKLRRAARQHPLRERRPRKGELIQIDGSPHAWFEARAPKCTLIAFIDDATSELMGARFYPSETSVAYLDMLAQYTSQHGRPISLYSDRHGIFTKHDPENDKPTQFERACLQLDIESILALSPQAKGRVERLFQTLQHRLMIALRLVDISDIESANVFLEQHFIAKHNAQFSKSAASKEDAHRAYSGSAFDLRRICALHHARQYSSHLSCQFEGKVLQVLPMQAHAPKGRSQANIVEHLNGELELLHLGVPLAFSSFVCVAHLQKQRAADDKTLNHLVDLVSNPKPKSPRPARGNLARLIAQIAHQDVLREQGIYTPTHTSELPRRGYKRSRVG